jgi:hypothetical protein
MYGVGEPITPGALAYSAAYSGPVNSSGTPIADATDPTHTGPVVGGRRRRGRKTAKKGRKETRKTRKMRGGASQVSMGGTYASFGGKGEAGLATYEQGVKPGNAF